jgi:hypothetical protein
MRMSSSGYGVVWPSFWTGSTGRQLRGDVTTQLVAVYLMTCSHKNSLGVYRCPPAYITTDTGIPLEGASKALRRLSEVGFCAIDEVGETIWVFEMALYQIGDHLEPKDNRVKSVHRLFGEIENEQIQQAFFKKYAAAYHLPEPAARPEKVSFLEGALKPLRSPSEANNYNYDNNYNSDNEESIAHPSDDAETVDLLNSPIAPKSKRAKKPAPVNLDFEAFWQDYPLKKAKIAAQVVYERIVKTGTATIGDLQAGAVSYAAERRGQDPKYTKQAPRWLREGCWADEAPATAGFVNGARPARSGAVDRLLNRINDGKREAS